MSEALEIGASSLVDALGGGLPLTLRPYAALGETVGLSEDATLAAIRELKETRKLRRIGARFSGEAFGYQAQLGALALPEESVEDVAANLAALPNVTHVFELDDRYALWYVLCAQSRTRLEIAEGELARDAGASDRYRVLPDEQFKVTMAFDADGAPEPPSPLPEGASPVVLDRDERALVRLLRGDLPLVARPFSDLAHTLGECGYDVDERWAFDQVKSLVAAGAVRGLEATLKTRSEPWRMALAVWSCPCDAGEAGTLVASFPEVVHCYERRTPGGGRAVYALVEAPGRAALDQTLERIRIAGELDGPRIAYPVREYARCPMGYFTEGD